MVLDLIFGRFYLGGVGGVLISSLNSSFGVVFLLVVEGVGMMGVGRVFIPPTPLSGGLGCTVLSFWGFRYYFIFTSFFEVKTLVRGYRWYRVDGDPMGIFSIQRIGRRICIYGSNVGLVGSFKESQFLLPLSGRYVQVSAFIALFNVLQLAFKGEFRQIKGMRLLIAVSPKAFFVHLKFFAASRGLSKFGSQTYMENQGVDELVVQLDHSMNLSAMEHGVKMVGMALAHKTLNRWGIRNILSTAWKDLGKMGIKWVLEKLFIISVQDQSMANKILEHVPWVAMKKNFVVKTWPPDLALEEVDMKTVPF